MSLSAGSRGPSPMSSGRSSPQPRRRLDEDPTKKDPKYKRFSTSIDRALALFESNNLQEWADYISFLGRLLKALQSHPSLPLIPSKSLVAQRLAQCLNPRLPSGVHQKTIEVYSYIFSLIGRDGLCSDLTLWTPGLMPVLSYASLTLKPHYLDLLERFYLPVGAALRPALRSLILALLPGIDEEGGEYFDKTLALIDAVRSKVGDDAYFWQCVLLATITAPARRQGALAFLGRRLPKLDGKTGGDGGEGGTAEEQRRAEADALINPEPGLLVRAFCAGLGDEQLLVQRGFLDLLVTDVPLASRVLQEKVSKLDLQRLVTAAAGVVMRRDMSLNRRLWVWYLGPEETNHQKYFEKHGLKALVDGLLEMLDWPDITPVDRARPYRICLSLMDRWEVGSLVAPKLFLPAIESLRAFERDAPSKEAYAEVFRSASMFFDGVEAGLIWGQMIDKINTAFSGDGESAIEHLQTVRFIIRTFNVQEEEMVLVHAPLAVLALLWFLGAEQKEDDPSAQELWRHGFLLAEEIWDLIPGSAFKSATPTVAVPSNAMNESAFDAILQFYGRGQVRSVDGSTVAPPFQLLQVAEWIFRDVTTTVQKALNRNTGDVGIRCRLFVNAARKIPKLTEWPGAGSLVSSFLTTLQLDPVPFSALRGMANIVAAMYSQGYLSLKDTDTLVASVTSGLWFYLSPDAPKFHVESVKALWNLQAALGDRRVEAAIATVMINSGFNGAESGRNFAVLWTHSVGSIGGSAYHMILTRPVFLFLDCLVDDGVEASIFARGWLQTLPSTNKLFWIFVEKLLGCQFLRDPGARDGSGAPRKRPVFEEDDCLEIATYYFQTLLNILRYSTSSMMDQLAKELVVNGDESKAKALLECGYGEEDMTLQAFFAKTVVRAVEGEARDQKAVQRVSKLHKIALGVLHLLLLSPYSKPLADMELENCLTARLISIMETEETYAQVSLLDVLHAALKLSLDRPASHLGHLRQLNRGGPDLPKPGVRTPSMSGDPEKLAPPPQLAPPQQLLKCLIGGLSSPSSRPVLDSWIFFLGECLPLITDVIFQMLLPLVECICIQIKLTFESLKAVFREPGKLHVPEAGGKNPESTLVALLGGLEQILAVAHDRLLAEELKSVGPKSPDAPSSGFFGNMVSGVFSVESPQNRSAAANNRLTVLLCFQDTVKICFSIWSWGDASSNGGTLDTASRESWGYTSLRMKGRARRILEHMFAAETLECLETLIELWPGRSAPLGERNIGSIFKLVNVLDGSRPKHTIPAIFNAVYSRTNPSALDPSRRSTLTADLGDVDVVVFLVEYARSLEDDAMDEIWADCMVFLRDVLANPFPHRQILPSLLSFTVTLGEKVDNTNFGEQRKMRKELGDLFLRMLTAVFTVTPVGSRVLEPPSVTAISPDRGEIDEIRYDRPVKGRTVPDDIIPILASIVPELRKVVVEPERVIAASVSISTSLIGPIFRSKSFPQNVSPALLDLVYQLTRLQNNQKAWRKELSDAFLDPKFFLGPPGLARDKWAPLTRQYLLTDRDRMMELLSRLTPPTTAGVLFGVGAAGARQEADRRTALTLKRIAFLIFAADRDAFVPKLTELEEKLVELLSATAVSSPSSATRADIYVVLRALALNTTPVHMAPLWPLINTELHNALVALLPDGGGSGGGGDSEHAFTDQSILQACKLLDALLVIAPDEFQLHEWLFITDTIEAVYHPNDWNPLALVDQLARDMPGGGGGKAGRSYEAEHGVGRKPWFTGRAEKEVDVRREIIAPFLRNLSIAMYEGVYAMGKPDLRGCEEVLLEDLFEEVVA